MQNIIELVNVTKTYENHVALKNVNLTIKGGKIIGLLGPNGCGKTTLFKMLTGLLKQSSGQILIDGKKVGVETKEIVSFLPERTYLPSSMKVSECLDFFQTFYKDFDRHRAEEMLKILNVDSRRVMKTLSKGTKEKVQLVLVMSRRAKLYLLDEPIGGVDPAARDFILHTIMRNYGEGATIIISTHLIRDIEEVLDEYMFINNREIVAYGDVREIHKNGQSLDSMFREVFRCY